jgi:hypothetical protein
LSIALASVGVVGILLALGRHGWLLAFLQETLPPIRIFRFPAKAMILCALAWALLSGIGLDGLRRGFAGGRTARNVSLVGAALSGVTLAALAAQALPTADAPAQLLHSLAAAACAVGAALWLGRAPQASLGLLALAVADLTLAHVTLNPTVPRELLARPPETTLSFQSPPPRRVFSFEYEGRNPYRTYRRTLFGWPKLAEPNPLGHHGAVALARNLVLVGTIPARWQLFGSFGFNSVIVATREQLELTLLLLSAEETPAYRRVLELAGVQYVVALHEEGLERLERVALVPTPFVRPLAVYAVPRALPRAYLVSGARVASDADAPSVLLDEGFDPRHEVVLSSGSSKTVDPGFAGQLRRLELGCDRLTAEVELDRSGYLVLLDAFDPNWRARIDDAPAQIARANIGFRAVPVQAGAHRVELVYRPRAAFVGLAVSLVALLGALAAGFGRSWSYRPRSG